MQIDSLTLVRTAMKCSQSTNETVVNSFDTVVSWFIANDGFRAESLTLPDPVKSAVDILKDFAAMPFKYPNKETEDESTTA